MVKRLLEDKRTVLLLSLLGVIALVLLASALNNMSFRPEKPLYHAKTNSQTGGVSLEKTLEVFSEIPFWKQAMFFVMLFLMVALVFSLLSPEARKRLIRMLIQGATFALIFFYLIKKNPSLFNEMLSQPNATNGTADTAPLENIPAPVFEPPHVSNTLSFLITFGITLILAVILWRIYLWWKLQNELLDAEHSLDKIVKVARTSLRELSLEGASQDAIIQCYENMSQAVSAQRGLQRSYTMTAAEFAQKLESAGLPREPVNRLTRLFESARYSSHTSTQSDISEAVSCLTLIVDHFGDKS